MNFRKNFHDNLFEQVADISKASAYNALIPEVEKLEAENKRLKQEKAILEIQLAGERRRVEALKEVINEVMPDNPVRLQIANI